MFSSFTFFLLIFECVGLDINTTVQKPTMNNDGKVNNKIYVKVLISFAIAVANFELEGMRTEMRLMMLLKKWVLL